MLKRLFLLLGIALLAACVREPQAESEGSAERQGAVVVGEGGTALPGTLAIRLTPEVADAVEAAARVRGDVATRSAVDDQMDWVFNQVGVEHFARIIPYDEQYEAGYRESGLNCWYRITFDPKKDLKQAVGLLRECPGVAVVEYTIEPQWFDRQPAMPLSAAISEQAPATRAGLPMNDPLLSSQWHFQNTGPSGQFPNRKAGADIDLFDAWKLCTGGEDIVVAVLDEPVQYTHPDLAANMWTNPNPVNGDLHGYNFRNQTSELDWKSYQYLDEYKVYRYADHGSHVAGTIAAVNDNGIGCCGIAGGKNGMGGVKIMSCQINGYSNVNVDGDAIVKAFTYAAQNGAVIAQCSWGYDIPEYFWISYFGIIRTAIDYFINNAGSKNSKYPNSPLAGGLVIFAAGNSGHNVAESKQWPAAYKPVVAVAAMGWDFQPSYFTDYGPWVDISAPGGDYLTSKIGTTTYKNGGVLSTILQDPSMDFRDGRDNSGCGYMQGTSMACPHVSGVAALGLAYASKIGKKYTPAEFTSLLLSSTHDLTPYLTGKKDYVKDDGSSGTLNLEAYRKKMGRGYVDALGLLLAIQGTPAVYIPRAEPTTVDLSNYFGGSASTLVLTSATMDAADLEKLGMDAVPPFMNGTMTFTCKNAGSALVMVKGLAGDTEITRELAIVVRDGLAGNGGWL